MHTTVPYTVHIYLHMYTGTKSKFYINISSRLLTTYVLITPATRNGGGGGVGGTLLEHLTEDPIALH